MILVKKKELIEILIYVTIFSRGILTAYEIHQFSGVPRGRVYDVLTVLEQKGFISRSWEKTVYYTAEPVEKVSIRLVKDTLANLEHMTDCLNELQDVCYPLGGKIVGVHEFQTDLAIDTQIRMELRRSCKEVLILCFDERILQRYADDIKEAAKRILQRYADDIKEAAKRIPVYVVVKDKKMAKFSPIKCYLVKRGIPMTTMEMPVSSKKQRLPVLAQFYHDRQGTIAIIEHKGRMICLGLVNNVSVFVAQSILQNIERIEQEEGVGEGKIGRAQGNLNRKNAVSWGVGRFRVRN